MTPIDSKPIAASRRIMIVAADASRLLQRRELLLRTLVTAGHQVMVIVAIMTDDQRDTAKEIGVTIRSMQMSPTGGMLPIADKAAVTALKAALIEHAPSAIVAFGSGPILLTARASGRSPDARLLAVATHLDQILTKPGLSTRWLTRRALKPTAAVAVYNTADARRIASLDLLSADVPIHTLPGAGVDLHRFPQTPLPSLDNGFIFAMMATQEASKGIIEFCQAARLVKAKSPSAKFRLALLPAAGAPELPLAAMTPYRDCVELHITGADTPSFLQACHVFVYPSAGEGLAHHVLEALATGRPAITTTAPGCAETIDERVSGILVPPGNVPELAAAMESFLRRPDLMAWMAKSARHKAERRFDARVATSELIRLMQLDGGPSE